MAEQTATETKEKTKEVAGHAAEEGRQVAQTAQQRAGAVADEARQEAGAVVSQASTQVRNVAEETKAQLQSQAQAQTEKVAEGLREIASELQALGRDGQGQRVAPYLEEAGSKLGDLASRMQSGGFEGTVNDLERFARRRPMAFLSGAAVAGFVAGRIFRGAKDDQQGHGQPPAGAVEPVPRMPAETATATATATAQPYPEIDLERRAGS